MKSNLQKEKRKKYVRLKKNFGWRILCAVGIIFSAVSLLTGCRMEQWEADISEKTEKSIRLFTFFTICLFFYIKNTCKQKYLLIQYSQALGHLNKKRWIL